MIESSMPSMTRFRSKISTLSSNNYSRVKFLLNVLSKVMYDDKSAADLKLGSYVHIRALVRE